MTEPRVYKRRKDLPDDKLLRLSVYYIYVSPEAWEVASLLNQLNRIQPKIATEEVESTYSHLHDTEHPMWVQARDMARKDPDKLKRILREEVGCGREKWDVRVVKPVRELAMLRLSKD